MPKTMLLPQRLKKILLVFLKSFVFWLGNLQIDNEINLFINFLIIHHFQYCRTDWFLKYYIILYFLFTWTKICSVITIFATAFPSEENRESNPILGNFDYLRQLFNHKMRRNPVLLITKFETNRPKKTKVYRGSARWKHNNNSSEPFRSIFRHWLVFQTIGI